MQQLDDLVQQVGELVHLFGYSMGGFIALLSAANGNKKIHSITTLGTKMKWSPRIAENEVKQLNPELIEEKVPAFAKSLEERHGDHWKDLMRRTADYMVLLGNG